MSNSKLVKYTMLSPNHSGRRTHSIDMITPHCVVGQLSAPQIAACFASPARQASCQYGIGTNGDIALIVDEANRSWCSSSNQNDQRAVTIECSSDSYHPYKMTSAVYNKLVDLCVDICKRNGKKRLLWLGTKEKTWAYTPKADEMLLSVHRWYAAKACPGDWLFSRMGSLAGAVTARLASGFTPYRVKVTSKKLVVREKPTAVSKKIMTIYFGGIYTIVKVSKNKKWGKLKSGAGWIALSRTQRV